MLLELPRFEHIDVTTPAQAVSCLQKHGDKAVVIAGATDLLGLMKDKVEGPELKIPEVLVNIKPVPELNRIAAESNGSVRIGATVTLAGLETSNLITGTFPVLSRAAHHVGTTQLRNMGTLGGNLCQRPRCMYFRHPHFLCYKKGGTKCFAVAGEHRDYHSILKPGKCVMAHPSDTAPALLALRARAVILGPGGERKMPLQEFFLGPNNYHETVMKTDEFLKEIEIPNPQGATVQVFLKQRVRHAADFALSSVAAVAQLSEGVFKEISLVLGGIAPLPVVATEAEEMVRGKRLDGTLIAKAADAALEGAKPLPMNRYKIDLTKALVRRALTSLSERGPAV